MRGKLIVIEGIDGSGKSVQAALLNIALERLGHAVQIIKARETKQNVALKKFLKDFDITTDSLAFMFLYQALHRKQYDRTKAALDTGVTVIADRWDASFFVYHYLFGPLSKRPKRLLKMLNRLAFENLEPDLCCFLNTTVSTAIKRRIARGDVISSIKEEAEFYDKVAAEYAKLLTQKSYYVTFDGSQSIEQVHRQIIEAVMPIITRG
ncbi:dTMP kinase [Candidatus Azambacteria bacterium RIFCSPHIGHO2_01_46_10]|uniref:Thymidylate kinase n=4 Tax=Candidatus Azamiibacteriota TaxID=1752741 RepID=A0A1F5C848_9BACT|nr:MAG: dTMP kinase [Candidatus Azambacteria bacterium RIFCSPHIGHO2_02_46_12]OGD36118.1 MAG: dTMP kinase [Candidatus Azambacteria bacterium RIFCSPHIGHO2_01_46_10]OGD39051.1 MAG: dTMP kinase [Candidatus Azambacteria bacterium RIFCSPLOWO2_01_FULL_46_26]OGD43345.1 MAG: dTMP kinase [Candidatus Azambacteria bacterium RIFCSPLOWO2_02_FULL_46_11]